MDRARLAPGAISREALHHRGIASREREPSALQRERSMDVVRLVHQSPPCSRLACSTNRVAHSSHMNALGPANRRATSPPFLPQNEHFTVDSAGRGVLEVFTPSVARARRASILERSPMPNYCWLAGEFNAGSIVQEGN